MIFSNISRSLKALIASMIMLIVAAIFFIIDVIADVFLIDVTFGHIPHSTLEITSVLIIIVALTSLSFQIKSLIRAHHIQKIALDSATGQLVSVINDHFEQWKLSESEKEVAWLLIKGLSIQEIADARNTKIGTVKSQSNAVYQKAGLQGRAELVSYFVEDLLA
ncbi:MAG: helix-turn-helix transcriptional regulator [Sedimenticolaceae bacterium]